MQFILHNSLRKSSAFLQGSESLREGDSGLDDVPPHLDTLSVKGWVNHDDKISLNGVPLSISDFVQGYADTGRADLSSAIESAMMNAGWFRSRYLGLLSYFNRLDPIVFAQFTPSNRVEQPAVAGLAVLMHLWLSRTNSRMLNDATLMAILLRENGSTPDFTVDVPGYRADSRCLVATGQMPDRDLEQPDGVDSSCGLSQWHSLAWDNLANRQNSLKSQSFRFRSNRRFVGSLPWWKQVWLMIEDHKIAISSARVPKPVVSEQDTPYSSLHPYAFTLNPRLNKRKWSELERTRWWPAWDVLSVRYLDRTAISVFTEAHDLGSPPVMFHEDEPNGSSLWLGLLEGRSNGQFLTHVEDGSVKGDAEDVFAFDSSIFSPITNDQQARLIHEKYLDWLTSGRVPDDTENLFIGMSDVSGHSGSPKNNKPPAADASGSIIFNLVP